MDRQRPNQRTIFQGRRVVASYRRSAPEKRGLRLLQKLKGEAAEKLSNVKAEDLLMPDSVEMLKAAIEKAYYPAEDYKVGATMDEFLHSFSR